AADLPLARLRDRFLELRADAKLRDRARPAVASGPALIPEAAQVRTLLAVEVPISRDIEAVGPAAIDVLFVQAFELAFGSHAEMVVHQVVSQLVGARAEAARPHVSG